MQTKCLYLYNEFKAEVIMTHQIRSSYQKNIVEIADRNHWETEIKFDSKHKPYVGLNINEKIISQAEKMETLVSQILKKQNDFHTHLLNTSYTPAEVKKAVDLLELFVIYEWNREIVDETLNTTAREKTLQSKKHMQAINYLEDIHKHVDLPEDNQKDAYLAKFLTAKHKVEKIFDDAKLVDKMTLKKPVLKALKVLAGYHAKLS